MPCPVALQLVTHHTSSALGSICLSASLTAAVFHITKRFSAHAGPTGKVLLLPEDPNAVIIMVATGTGTASASTAWICILRSKQPKECDLLSSKL